MSRFKIAPSILSADFGRLELEVEKAERCGADWIHVDVMDGHFVPNLTIGPGVVEAIAQAATVPVDVHLMIEAPERSLAAYARSERVSALGVHVEACPHLHRTLQQIHDLGKRATVALNPSTPPEAIREVLPSVDQVLVMTVNPGFGGQQFIPEVLGKIQTIRQWIDKGGRAIDLVVDGGVNLDTVEEAALHGARVFVMGNAFFKAPDPARFTQEVRALLAPLDSEGP